MALVDLMSPIETNPSLGKRGGFSYGEAFSRHLGLINPDEQARLRRSRVAIIGMGGVGGIHLVTLARLGIGGFPHLRTPTPSSWPTSTASSAPRPGAWVGPRSR